MKYIQKNKKKIISFNKNSFTLFYLFFISKVNENNKWIIEKNNILLIIKLQREINNLIII